MTLPGTIEPPTGLTATPASRLLASLNAATQASPLARKRLVGPDVNWGRELLVALARRTGGWIGWEATNLRAIADELALVGLSERGVRVAGDVEIGSVVGRALDALVESGRAARGFAALQHSLGFRDLVRDSVLELRMAGIGATDLRAAAGLGSPAHDVAGVLERYEALLVDGRITDPAGVIAEALRAFDEEAPFVLDGELHVAPGLVARGLAGQLLERLLAHGARPLAGDAPERAADGAGLFATSAVVIDLFAAATPSDELREVFRRIMAEGLAWDEVEIVATDTDTYGIALDVLCQRLELGATMLQGIPLSRTRIGRALDRWFAWLQDGLPADVLRQALEAGELESPGEDVAPTALARELRWQQVGWGRARYEAAVETLAARARDPQVTRHDDEADDDYESRVASRRRSASALHGLLTRLLEVVPAVPERGSSDTVRTTTAALARATRDWLALFAAHGAAEQHTRNRLDTRLGEVAAIEEPEAGFATALAALRLALADLRAWPLLTSDRKPWSSSGGMVHLTDLAHAGTTGRRRTFVVGLDADRAGSGNRQDPLLTESVRGALEGRLVTSRERRDDNAQRLAAALAGLRGRATLSYSTSGSLDGRDAGPAPVLLQAWRIIRGDPSVTYEMLRHELQPPACAVPEAGTSEASRGIVCLDARDVWLDALADGPLLLDGSRLLRDGFTALAAGAASRQAAMGAVFSEFHGRAEPAAELLDSPRGISPSALEKLAACPLAWFYRYGIGLRAPQDPEYDAERWLDNMQRGVALHEVYERFVSAYLGRRRDILRDEARADIEAITEQVIAEWREQVPPPSVSVYEAEAEELRRAAIVFLVMERDDLADGDGAEWHQVEVQFGGEAGRHHYRAGTRDLPIFGRADRVDMLPDGSLRVVDYKTGSSGRFQRARESGLFKGGRHLQPALYAEAVAQVTGASVARFEYRFPTARGGSDIVRYDAPELARARAIVESLLAHVESGRFVPTDDCDDCRFCDYQPVCRVQQDTKSRFPKTRSPRAEWAARHGPELVEYAEMRANRTTVPGEA